MIGLAMLITGLFFVACGLAYVQGREGAGMAVLTMDSVLFLGSGMALLVAGGLLMGHLRLGPPGSLMTRREGPQPGERERPAR